MYFSDGTWSEGIISAAKEVGNSTIELCAMSRKQIDDDNNLLTVIAVVRQITASTVQILTSSSVHTAGTSQSQVILNSAAKHIMSANEKLVKHCEEQISQEKIEEISLGKTQTSRHANEIDAQLDILTLEKKLDKARLKLGSIRKSRYSKLGDVNDIWNSLDKKGNSDLTQRVNSFDSDKIQIAVKRASVLELATGFKDNPEYLSPKAKPSIKTRSNSRRGFSFTANGGSSRISNASKSIEILGQITEEK